MRITLRYDITNIRNVKILIFKQRNISNTDVYIIYFLMTYYYNISRISIAIISNCILSATNATSHELYN